MEDIVQLMREAEEHCARGTIVSVNLLFWQRIVKEIEDLRHKVDVLTLEHYGDWPRKSQASLWPTGSGDTD